MNRHAAAHTTSLALLAAASALADGSERDFGLPWSPAEPVLNSPEAPRGPWSGFFEQNGRKWVVHWDRKLETPRHVAARSRFEIAGSSSAGAELVEAARDFLGRNAAFFGVSPEDLLGGTVTPVNRHRLVGFEQAVRGIPIRGAGVRLLIDPSGAIASVDAFLVRASLLPSLPPVEWRGENEILGIVDQTSRAQVGAMERQVVFPGPDPRSAVPAYCLEARHQDGRARELFYSAGGVYLGERDPAHYFDGKVCVQGFSTDPEDIFTTADRAGGYFPIPGARVFARSGFRTVTGDDGTAVVSSPAEDENVWPSLSFGIQEAGEEACLSGVIVDGINERLNRDGIKTIFRIQAAPDCFLQDRAARGVELFDPNLRIRLDENQCHTFTFEDAPSPPEREGRMAFNLLVYHHIRRIHMRANDRISNNQLEGVVVQDFPLQVNVDSTVDNPVAPKYVGWDCDSVICIAQQLGRQSWIPPTIVHHEYSHHVIRTVANTLQAGRFVEGIADAITAFANKDPRIGFIAPTEPGFHGFQLDDEDRFRSEDDREEAGATFWRLFNFARQEFRDEMIDLFYVWLAQRHVEKKHLDAFDFNVLLEQLLVADASFTGMGMVTGLPEHGEHIISVFRDAPIFQTRFLRGDVDSSGSVDLSDAVAGLQYLFLGARDVRCLDAMDADDTGSLDLSDPLWLLSFLFLGGAFPAYPFPECDIDLTDRDLWCAEPPGACR